VRIEAADRTRRLGERVETDHDAAGHGRGRARGGRFARSIWANLLTADWLCTATTFKSAMATAA